MPSYHHVTDDTGMVFFIEPLMLLRFKEIDDDHFKLFKLIDDLNNKSLSATDKDAIFTKLIEYATKHFSLEEALFLESNYDSEHHKSEHLKILTILKQFNSTKTKMSDLLKFLTAWLNHHILVEDKKFVDFYRTKV